VAGLAAGCAAPPYQKDRELEDLLAAYRRQTALAGEREAQRQAQGIRRLAVERREDTGEFLVSADLERASAPVVVRRLLEETRTPYVIRVPRLAGHLTARLERVPLRRALALLLEPAGLSVWDRHGVLAIGDDPPPGATEEAAAPAEALETPHPQPPAPPPSPLAQDPPAGPAAPVSRTIQLRHLDVDTVGKMLEALFPVDAQTGGRALQFAPQPFTSSMVLVGTGPAVARAQRLLADVDRDPFHVLLEVLVIEFDTNELERLGTQLDGFQNRQYGSLVSRVGNAAFNTLSFAYTRGLNQRLAFQAAIDVLASQDKARVIARPYTAAMSGKKAALKIVRERDIQQPFQGLGGTTGTVSPPPPVTKETGVSLEVTPWVLEDGRIRLELAVEESVFVDQLATNVLSETDRNAASTTMMVESGQSIIIGGLAVQRKSSGNAGLPWLRHVPLLNLATGRQSGAEQKQDVIVYITPYIVGPGIDPPFPNPDAFKFRDGTDDLTSMERLERRPLVAP
jgi:hypothetical protein